MRCQAKPSPDRDRFAASAGDLQQILGYACRARDPLAVRTPAIARSSRTHATIPTEGDTLSESSNPDCAGCALIPQLIWIVKRKNCDLARIRRVCDAGGRNALRFS